MHNVILKRFLQGFILPLSFVCSSLVLATPEDGEPYVYEEAYIEVTRPVSARGVAGQIRVKSPSEQSCRSCGDSLEIDETTRVILRPSGQVIDISQLSQYLPSNGQVDVAGPPFAILIQLDK